jgi:tetratricopeptide (TPR) repeat protein
MARVALFPVLVTSVVTAVVALGWLEVVLRPAPRRRLATDGRWFTILLLFSAWALINWGALIVGPSSDAGRVLLRLRWVLLAANVIPAYLIYRPMSRGIRRARRFLKHGDLDRAAAAYQRVLDSGRRGERPRAALGLGFVLMRRGDLDDAAAAFQRAIDSGSPNIAAQAAYDFGCLLEEQGDIEGARAAYRRAVHCGPPGVRENAVRALLILDAPREGA